MNVLELLMGGGVLAIVGFAIGTHLKVTKVQEDADRKIGRVYERIDETKKDTEIKFVKKDMCDLLHKQTADKVEKIEASVKFIPQIQLGIELLLQKNGINLPSMSGG